MQNVKCCYNCTNRKIACHVDCNTYMDEAIKVRERNEMIAKEKLKGYVADNARILYALGKKHNRKR